MAGRHRRLSLGSAVHSGMARAQRPSGGTREAAGVSAGDERAQHAVVAASDPHTRSLAISPELVAAAQGYAAAATAPATRRAYTNDWKHFEAWCRARGLSALPAEATTVALYLSARAEAGRKTATIRRALAAIAKAHRTKGLPTPRTNEAVQLVMRGIARSLGTSQVQKAPLLPEALSAIVARLPPSVHGARDRALLLLGFAGAFRRSELVALDVADLVFTAAGLEVVLHRSKADQEGAGLTKAVPLGSHEETCPVRATREWLAASRITSGPLFRCVTRHGAIGLGRLDPGTVARVVKRSVLAAGLDATKFSGHSLRAGLVTAAMKAGKQEAAVMRHTGHRSSASFRKYIRYADLFEQNCVTGLGL